MDSHERFTRLSLAIFCFGLIVLGGFLAPSSEAQIRSTRVELATLTDTGEVLIHVRLPRGQSVDTAVISVGDETLELEVDPVPLPVTRWVLLDASDEMVNLQSVVQSNIQRILRNSEERTGLVFFNDEVNLLRPTDRSEQVEEFLTEYIATAGEPACLGDALQPIADSVRPLDQSWRILLVTAGDFSRQMNCTATNIPAMPAPVEIIAITDTVDPALQELVDQSNGSITTANLRTVEARINEIRTQWGQPTYALREVWPEEWDSGALLDLNLMLANGVTENTAIRLGTYNVPPAPTPTTQPTPIVLDTIPPREMVAPTEDGQAAAIDPDSSAENGSTPPPMDTSGGDGVALLLIVGAVLFVVGAIVMALALSRARRVPSPQPSGKPGFYETLDASRQTVDDPMGATKIRERSILDDDVAITRLTPAAASEPDDTFTADSDEVGDEDDLLVTQVLTDERFQQMMRQSKADDEIVGYLRLLSDNAEAEDFALTRRGAVIGRSMDCDIQIRGDRAISRQHARLDVRPNGQVTVSRLSAVNPVIVGSVQVSNRHPLRPNDVIHLSDRTQLIFIRKNDAFDEEMTEI